MFIMSNFGGKGFCASTAFPPEIWMFLLDMSQDSCFRWFPKITSSNKTSVHFHSAFLFLQFFCDFMLTILVCFLCLFNRLVCQYTLHSFPLFDAFQNLLTKGITERKVLQIIVMFGFSFITFRIFLFI